MTFLPCPKCGNNGAKINTVMTDFESCLSFLGFFLVIPGLLLLRHFAKRDELLFVQGKNDAGCKICGHRFKILEAQNLPMELRKYWDEDIFREDWSTAERSTDRVELRNEEKRHT